MTHQRFFKGPALIFSEGEYVKTIPGCQSDRIGGDRFSMTFPSPAWERGVPFDAGRGHGRQLDVTGPFLSFFCHDPQ
jgi:hypothetical protein